MNRFALWATALATFVTALGHFAPLAQTNEVPAGQVEAELDGKRITLPMLATDYEIEIEGAVATVKVTQQFTNPSGRALNARYLFPLNQNAAVFAMRMEVGNELIEAVIKEKQEAKKVFETAKSEGKAASLLTQHRPNMFTQDIANLMPGLPVKITLSYVQRIPKLDGDYQLVIPMIVAPRYGQGAGPAAGQREGWTIGNLPDHPDVADLNLPAGAVAPRVSLRATMRAGLPIANFGSNTHALTISGDAQSKVARLQSGKITDDRDFVLRFSLEGDNLQAGVLGTMIETGGVASLLIEPPKIVPQAMITPRELIFLIDTSGSQAGQPLAASKEFMRAALDNLRPDDQFRIIDFAETVTYFSREATAATPANLRKARRFVRDLDTGGGTNIDRAIKATFGQDESADRLRIVVFLSDGLVGNEADVISRIRQDIGQTRIYSFGVGASVNRYLMDGVAKHGRGYARYINPENNAKEVATRFARDLKTPVLTDISIDWGTLDVTGVVPKLLPDLFAGGSTQILARYAEGGAHQIRIKGKVNGVAAELPVTLTLPDAPPEATNAGLPLIWARQQITEKTLDFNTGMGNKPKLKKEVISLGLNHSLQSQFTSFVAVSKQVYNDQPDQAQNKSVALPKVAATAASAYPSAIAGSSTPEPETVLGLMLALILACLRYWRRISTVLRARFGFVKGATHAA